jgi:hypothetical protein
MLLLETTNRIILDVLAARQINDPNEKHDIVDITCADFDDATYTFFIDFLLIFFFIN